MPPVKAPPFQVDACVVSFNTKEITLATLTQLRGSLRSPVNIMAWDNASTDGSAEALVEFSKRNPVTVICSHENLGYGVALNRAFSLGSAPYLLALNSDLCFPQLGWLETLTGYMDKHPDVGCVAPLLLDSDGKIGGAGVTGTVSARKIRWWREPYEKYKDKLRAEKECISVCGACMLMRRSAFLDCQGFDPNYVFYFEETSLHRLMRVFGWKIMFNPAARVTHLWNKSPSPNNLKQKNFKQGNDYFNFIWGEGVVISDD